jgi:hypothetical protein
MIRFRCDGCGTDLPPDGSGHFIVRIEAFAAAGRLEFSAADLQRDHRAEIERLVRQAGRMSQDELEDGVYRAMRFDLCPTCHRRYLAAPIAALRREADNSPTRRPRAGESR